MKNIQLVNCVDYNKQKKEKKYILSVEVLKELIEAQTPDTKAFVLFGVKL